RHQQRRPGEQLPVTLRREGDELPGPCLRRDRPVSELLRERDGERSDVCREGRVPGPRGQQRKVPEREQQQQQLGLEHVEQLEQLERLDPRLPHGVPQRERLRRVRSVERRLGLVPPLLRQGLDRQREDVPQQEVLLELRRRVHGRQRLLLERRLQV